MDGTINENVKIVRNAKISTKVNATGAYQLYNFSSIRTTANNNPGSSTSGDNGNGNATLIQKATILGNGICFCLFFSLKFDQKQIS